MRAGVEAWRVTLATVVGAGAVAWTFGATFWPNPPARVSVEERAELRQQTRAAFRWLRAAARTDGTFVYATEVAAGQKLPAYNFVRHGGAAWALASYGARNEVPDLAPELKRVADFIHRNLKPIGAKGALAVVSDPEVEKNGRERRAALGASALALLALLEVERVAPGATPPDTLRGLGTFLIWMQRANGRFWPTYLTGRAVRADVYPSDYFPGEAALALFALAAWDHERASEWADAAWRGVRFLMASQPESEPVVDAWALQALRAGWDQASPEDRRRGETFVRRIVETQLGDQSVLVDPPQNYGCYGEDGRVAATAARLEGLLAALHLLDASQSAEERWALSHSIQLALGCVRRGQVAGGGIITQHPRTAGAGQSFVRVDNVQHALMAMMQFDRDDLRPLVEQNRLDHELANARWRRQTLGNLRQRATRFRGVDAGLTKLNHVDWVGSTIRESVFRGAVFVESKLRRSEWLAVEGQALRVLSSDLREARFSQSNLAAADFSFSDLSGARFEDCNLSAASFAGSNLRGATYDERTLLPFSRDEAQRRGMVFASSKTP